MLQLSLSDNEEPVDKVNTHVNNKENVNTLNISEYLPDSFQASKDDSIKESNIADASDDSEDGIGTKKPKMLALSDSEDESSEKKMLALSESDEDELPVMSHAKADSGSEHDLQIDDDGSEPETTVEKEKTTSEDIWKKVNMETSDAETDKFEFSKKKSKKVESDSFASESDDDKIKKKKSMKKKKSKVDSESSEEEMESEKTKKQKDDTESETSESEPEKKKKNKKKKENAMSDSDNAALSCSDDELLQDTELALHALVDKGKQVAGVSVVGHNMQGTASACEAAVSALETLIANYSQSELIFWIPAAQAPIVIGRSGQKVAKFERETGAFIKIDESLAERGLVPIQIRGRSEDCTKARAAIEQLCQDVNFNQLDITRPSL